MAYSWEQQIYPAGSQNVTVSIAYLDKSFIYVYLDGVLTTNYMWASDAVIRLDTPLTATTEVLLVRRTEKEYLFIQFAAGAPFISENLDTQNTQFLHLAQEMVEGRAIEGFYGDISMNGYKITNLGRGTEPGDAVNKEQLDEVDNRVTQLEQTFTAPTNSYPWFTNTTVETDVLTPGFTFTKAAVYLNGVCQTPGYSYVIVDNTIMLADPVPAGTHIMARLGEDVPNEQGYASTAQLSAVQASLTAAVDGKADKGDAGLGQLGGGATGISVFKAANGPAARTALGMSTVGNALAIAADAAAGRTALDIPTRKKMEVYYSGLSLAIPTTATNFINLVKSFTPTSGSLNAFFNTSTNKLNVYDDDASVVFKVNITGTWAGMSNNRSMVMSFTGTNGNTLTVNRVNDVSPDVIQFFTYFSIDAGGNIVTNGAPITIQSLGSTFTATAILITVEQVTRAASITPV